MLSVWVSSWVIHLCQVHTNCSITECIETAPAASGLLTLQEAPVLGAWGLGWEVWCDGQEITQFTYFQQAGGTPLPHPAIEITYGLERILMALQVTPIKSQSQDLDDKCGGLLCLHQHVLFNDVKVSKHHGLCHQCFACQLSAIAALQTVPHKLNKPPFLLSAVEIIYAVLCCFGLSRKRRI